jgi:hypothetical protein
MPHLDSEHDENIQELRADILTITEINKARAEFQTDGKSEVSFHIA